MISGSSDVRNAPDMTDLLQQREQYLATGKASADVRPVVLASWERCRAHGLDPRMMRVQSPDAARLSEARRRNAALLAAAEPILSMSHGVLGERPHLLALADPACTILRLWVDPVAEEAGRHGGNLFEGASWHERETGCNGAGTCIAEGRALILIGAEHFQQEYVGWTCIGVPLKGPDGALIGALDLSVPNEHVEPHTWGWITTVASNIEAAYEALKTGGCPTAAAPELASPFDTVRGVLELLAQQMNVSPTHIGFVQDAIRELAEAERRMQATLGAHSETQMRLVQEREALKRLADRHERQSRLFEQIAATTPDFIYVFDRDGRFRYANRRLLEVWGRSAEDAFGKSLYELGYPQWHADMHMRELRQVIETKAPIKGEVPFKGGSGISGIYEYIFTPVIGPDGEVEVIAGTTRDVTQRKELEQAAEDARRRLSSALIAGEIGTFEWDVESDRLWGDANFARIFGLALGPNGSAPLAKYLQAIHPEDREHVNALVRRTLQSGCDYEAEYRIANTPEVRWVVARGKAERDASGKVVRFPGVVLNVTGRKEAEAAMRQAKEEAERLSRAKDQFLSVLSHELRTPLTPVVMTLAALEMEQGLPPSLREDLAMIRRNVDLEARLIDDMLDLSRVINGKMHMSMQDVSVHGLLSSVCDIFSSDLQAKQLRLAWDLQAKRDVVRADSARLHQVVWNLLKNAIKFTPEGGTITMGSANTDDGSVRFWVQDTGTGIAADALTRIFDAFEQGGDGMTRRFGGLGLGLAISKAIIDMHHARISASSDGTGRGARFTVEMAPATARSATPDATAPSRERSGANIRVLLVEDHADTRRMLRRLLENAGFHVTTASSVESAMKVAEANVFDLLLSDVGLPDGSGIDLMRQIRTLKPEVPGIAVTGYGMEQDVRACLEAGFACHLTKPLDIDKLKAEICRVAGAGSVAGNDDPGV